VIEETARVAARQGVDDLVMAPDDGHGDDAGVGIVLRGAHEFTSGTRQCSPHREKHGAPAMGQLPAVFDAKPSCDLDRDGFTDPVVSTDPPYDDQGQPPSPSRSSPAPRPA
jgi:hypothetical protein